MFRIALKSMFSLLLETLAPVLSFVSNDEIQYDPISRANDGSLPEYNEDLRGVGLVPC